VLEDTTLASNTLWQQSEVVRTKLFPFWRKRTSCPSDFINKGEVEIVANATTAFRSRSRSVAGWVTMTISLATWARLFSPSNVMLQSFYSMRLNFEFDQLNIKATTNKAVAVQNPFLQCIADGFREFELLWDKVIHGNGTALLATSNAYSTSTGYSSTR